MNRSTPNTLWYPLFLSFIGFARDAIHWCPIDCDWNSWLECATHHPWVHQYFCILFWVCCCCPLAMFIHPCLWDSDRREVMGVRLLIWWSVPQSSIADSWSCPASTLLPICQWVLYCETCWLQSPFLCILTVHLWLFLLPFCLWMLSWRKAWTLSMFWFMRCRTAIRDMPLVWCPSWSGWWSLFPGCVCHHRVIRKPPLSPLLPGIVGRSILWVESHSRVCTVSHRCLR